MAAENHFHLDIQSHAELLAMAKVKLGSRDYNKQRLIVSIKHFDDSTIVVWSATTTI